MLSVQVLVRPVVFPAAGLPCRVLQASVMATARNLPVTVPVKLTRINTLYWCPTSGSTVIMSGNLVQIFMRVTGNLALRGKIKIIPLSATVAHQVGREMSQWIWKYPIIHIYLS